MRELIKTILDEWKDKILPEVIEREIDLNGYVGIKPKKIIVVTGFRRAGKTYLVFRLIKRLLKEKGLEQVIYVNFEDERIPSKTEFLTEFLPVVKQTFTKQAEFLFLDEIHNIPKWSKWLRRVYDNEKMQIFVTGSSSKVSSKEIPTELRGRFLEINVFPLSFKEFLAFKGVQLNLKKKYSESERIKLLRALNEFLYFGGMPEVVLAGEEKKVEIIHSYFNTVVRRDIIERFNIKNEESLKALLRLLLNSTNYTISKMYDNLKSLNFEVGKSTIQNYLNYIENSYFMYSLPIFSYKIKDQLQYARKIYFIDTSFVNFLSTKFSKNRGRLYENLVFIELMREKNKNIDMDIYYWRAQQTKEEVDFVIKEGLKVKKLIQVCYDITDYDTKKREIRSLLKALKEFKLKQGIIITENKEGEEKHGDKKIIYIPLWKWLLS